MMVPSEVFDNVHELTAQSLYDRLCTLRSYRVQVSERIPTIKGGLRLKGEEVILKEQLKVTSALSTSSLTNAIEMVPSEVLDSAGNNPSLRRSFYPLPQGIFRT